MSVNRARINLLTYQIEALENDRHIAIEHNDRRKATLLTQRIRGVFLALKKLKKETRHVDR